MCAHSMPGGRARVSVIKYSLGTTPPTLTAPAGVTFAAGEESISNPKRFGTLNPSGRSEAHVLVRIIDAIDTDTVRLTWRFGGCRGWNGVR